MISLIRVDDRLVHGQCLASLLQTYGIQSIVVVDDEVAANALMKKIMESVVPKGVRLFPLSVKDAETVLGKAQSSKQKVLVLSRLPSTAEELFEAVPELPKDLNVAQVAAEGASFSPTKYAHLNERETQALDALNEKGVHVWLNTVPGEPVVEWSSVAGRAK